MRARILGSGEKVGLMKSVNDVRYITSQPRTLFFLCHTHTRESLSLIHSSKHFALLVFLSNILVANFLLSSHVHAYLFARVRACLLL
jgi:hypothetical protein